MKINDLNEAISSVVYHVTSYSAASNIFKTKRFKLTSSVGTDAERAHMKSDKYYYLSTTRTKTGDYTLHNTYKHGVTFKLNGQWFNERYAGGPVDYWEGAWIKSREAGSKDRYSEMEDRIFSDKPYIEMKNINDAILEVHILTDKEDSGRFFGSIVYGAVKNKVPYFVYFNDKDYIIQNKAKAASKEEVKELIKSVKPVNADGTMKATDWLAPYKELYYKSNKKDLSKTGERYRYKILYYLHDFETGLKADLHNSRSNSRDADNLSNFIKIMKKEKWTNPQQYVDAMHKKWSDIDDRYRQ